MPGTRTALVVGLAVAALAVAGCGGGNDNEAATDTETTTTETTTTATGTKLVGTVGPGFTISLTTEDGQAVTTLPAGAYTIAVDDKSSSHNFHLTGPGVDDSTEVSEEATETFNVDLQSGTYSFVCDPHSASMNGSFEVTG
jgi:plastocyanin